MGKRVRSFVCAVAVLLALPVKAFPQEPSSEAVAAARELMVAAKTAEQINLMVPHMMQQLKPLIARGNALIERDYDTLVPVIMASMNAVMEEILSEGAKIHARHLTVEEMRGATAFFRSPAGQSLLRKQPEILQETSAMGQRFGQTLARELETRMTDQLRKRGHDI